MSAPPHCSKCGVTKTLDDFYNHRGRPGGKQTWCKACCGGLNSEPCACGSRWIKSKGMCRGCFYKAYPRDTECGHQPHWCAGKCASCYEAGRREVDPERSKSSTLRSKYGVTLADVKAAQASGCEICGITTVVRGKYFHVDHDHATGKYRGMLCHKCNIGLGHFRDSTKLLQAAIDYLNRPTRSAVGRPDPWKARRVS